jgi:hypothetical protein
MYIRILLIALLLSAGRPVPAGSSDTRAAAALFENFETVFHTTPALLSGPYGEDSTAFMREPFDYLALGLDKAGDQAGTAVLAESESVLLGTKDYRFPDGLGQIVSTRCYIAVLRKGSTFDLFRYFGRSPMASAAGSPVWNWAVDLGEFGDRKTRLSSLYVTQIAHNYVLISNNLVELQKLSERLSSSENNLFPVGIHGWEDVRQHEFWGYRNYRHVKARSVGTMVNGLEGIESDAEALILYVDRKRNEGVLCLLGSKGEDATARSLNVKLRTPPLKEVGPGRWETLFPLADGGPFSDGPWQVMWFFGLGVVV